MDHSPFLFFVSVFCCSRSIYERSWPEQSIKNIKCDSFTRLNWAGRFDRLKQSNIRPRPYYADRPNPYLDLKTNVDIEARVNNANEHQDALQGGIACRDQIAKPAQDKPATNEPVAIVNLPGDRDIASWKGRTNRSADRRRVELRNLCTINIDPQTGRDLLACGFQYKSSKKEIPSTYPWTLRVASSGPKTPAQSGVFQR